MRRCFIPLTLLTLLALTACGKAEPEAAGKPQGGAAVSVDAVTVASEMLPQTLTGVGSLRADESVMLSSEVAGRIQRIGFDEGRPVRRGQVLFELDPAIARAESEQAEASYQLASRNHQRAQELFSRGLVSQSDRDSTATNFQLAQAARSLAAARLSKTRIEAPFDGVAGLRRVSPGDFVTSGQELVSVEAVKALKLDFRLPEAALPLLSTGQSLQLQIDAYPGEVFRGELYAIEPRVADDTRSIGLRARLANPEGKLRPGLFARVELQADAPTAVLVVPEQAVFPRGNQQFVYVIEGSQAVLRAVTIGRRMPGRVEVRGGLTRNDVVITSGLQHLNSGTPVSRRAGAPAAPDTATP